MPENKYQPKEGMTPPSDPPMPTPIMLHETFTATREINKGNKDNED